MHFILVSDDTDHALLHFYPHHWQ